MELAEVVAARTMQSLYIWLDLAFLVVFLALLIWSRRYQALIAGLIGGAIYFAVDYGVFYALLGTRSVTGASTVWFLLWLSFSYGLTNFAWIWLWLDRDKRALEWSLFIITGWLFIALLSQDLGYDAGPITIARGTDQYHGVMALLMFVGYGSLAVYNIRQKDESKRAPLFWILTIGILVQLSWEVILAVSGIRHFAWNTLIVNSLLETNMGLPYLYMIHRLIARKWDEGLRPVGPRAGIDPGEAGDAGDAGDTEAA